MARYTRFTLLSGAIAMLLSGCNQTPQRLEPNIKAKIVKRSPFADFQDNTGGTCDFQNKTVIVQLSPGGTGEFIACEDYSIKRHGVVSSGRPGTHDTIRGNFWISRKYKTYDSKKYPSSNGKHNMNYAQFFKGGFAIHQGNVYGLSHGCIRTQKHNAKWLFNWTSIGTKIIIQNK
jgi:hypothetical protein